MATPPKLHIVHGTPAPDVPEERVRKRVRRLPGPENILQCPRCGGREVIETKIGVIRQDGRSKGGTKQTLCVLCLLKGERVLIV